MMSVGRWTASIVQAMVALLPLPVMPSSVWKRSPRTTPSDNSGDRRRLIPGRGEIGENLELGHPGDGTGSM